MEQRQTMKERKYHDDYDDYYYNVLTMIKEGGVKVEGTNFLFRIRRRVMMMRDGDRVAMI